MDIEKKITRYHKRFNHRVTKIDYFLQFICLLLFIISGCFKNGSNDPVFWNLLPMSVGWTNWFDPNEWLKAIVTGHDTWDWLCGHTPHSALPSLVLVKQGDLYHTTQQLSSLVFTQRSCNVCPHKNPHTDIYLSFTHHCQSLEATTMSFRWRGIINCGPSRQWTIIQW